jgi:transposase
MENAVAALGSAATNRIITLALYLLGADLRQLAEFVETRMDTVKALAKRALRDGLPALEDRRCKKSTFLPREQVQRTVSCKLQVEDEAFIIEFEGSSSIRLLRRHRSHCRTVLLTMLGAGLLKIDDVAPALELSHERTRKLQKQLEQEGVDAVLDKRRGQQQDYKFTPEIKSELILQFTINAVSGRRTSGRVVAEDLQKRCEIELSERSVRMHLDKLGLSRIADSLPGLLEAEKKTSSDSSR